MNEKKVTLKVASLNKLREVRGETQWTRLIAEENAEKAKSKPIQTLQPTPISVTSPAGQSSRRP